MTDRPTADDLANKSERDLAYAWECAGKRQEAGRGSYFQAGYGAR